ncbi:MAG: alginate export family protein [Pseudomonas sp.]|uniref:alginate export family protein n=1 Tax=Pseudomonas sp. TaxID=306 RepID=UPI003391E924
MHSGCRVGIGLWVLTVLLACPIALAAASRCEGTAAPGLHAPTPADPYPLNAAGWGPELSNGRMASRWVEDWTGMRAAGEALPFKAMSLGDETSLTLSAEARVRYDAFDNAQLSSGNDYQQGLLRGVLGADLRFNPHLRLYGEIGTGQVAGRRDRATANFQNDASLQQLFVDARGYVGTSLVGAMLGRQEFADGPRQLISLSDGPNLHRSWNGVRLYAHGRQLRLGAYELRATGLEPDIFDERIESGERLRGLNASLGVSSGHGPNSYLEPFWIHSEKPGFRSGGQLGLDERDTLGMRLWGRQGALKFDWTLAQQRGRYGDRDIDAWGLFSVHSLALSDRGWQPRLTAHVDLASGGAYGSGTHRGFNPLYASSNYLGEGGFLSLSNLLMVAPGLALSPTSSTQLAVEYGFARRLDEDDAVYAGGMRAYAGTQAVQGRGVGGLGRVAATWTASPNLTVLLNVEHLDAGEVLRRAGLPSAAYAAIGATYRY